MLCDMGTAMGWFWTTDDGRGGLAAMLELDCCMATLPGMGEDIE